MIHALILAAAAALPTPTASPAATPAPLFAPPKHWLKIAPGGKPDGTMTPVASFQRFVDGYSQQLNLIEGPNTPLPLADLAQVSIDMLVRDMKAQVVENGAVSTCGAHAAWRVKYHADISGKPMTMVQEFALGGGHSYVMTYARLQSAKDDPDALLALESLCPPPEEAASADTAPVPMQGPDGWKRINASALASSPGTASLDIQAMWIGDVAGGFPQSINLIRNPLAGPSKSIGDQVPLVIDMLKRQFPQLTMRTQHAEKLCDKYDGWYFEYATPMQGHDVIVEQTIVQADNVMYIASYGRASSVPESAAARASIDSLCPTDAKIAS
jgi:hypothetical protein